MVMQQEGTSNKYQGLQRRAPRSSCCYEVMLRQPVDTQTDKQTDRYIPCWNIRCVLRSRLKLVSRERKRMMLMLRRKMLMLRRRILRRRLLRPERRHTLCASLRSGNALQRVTRATPHGFFCTNISSN